MYTMKDVCRKVNMPYETLKYYCNEGLVPNVKRNKNNYRIFDDRDVEWINSLTCLKKCGMSIAEMKEYLLLCIEGPSTITQRKEILAKKRKNLLEEMQQLQKSIDFIDWKQQFYDDVLSGKTEYTSSLIQTD